MAKENKRLNVNIDNVFALLKLLEKDKRYNPESYSFVMSSLEFITKKLKRKGHVSGNELLEGLKEYTIDQFGPMSRTVLEHWGIKTTDDFGEIVFNMIEAGILGRTEDDSKSDFHDKFDFKSVFDGISKFTIR